ncbi:MAG: peptidase domain-containing ABC transporter [Pseudomonadota bacterium]
MDSLASFLKSVSIFSAFTPAEIETLADLAETRRFGFGDSVYKAGDPSDGLYVIRAGAVRIFTVEEEKEISMGVRKEGAVFSEIGLLGKYPHESSVRASGKTELLFFARDKVAPLLSANRNAHSFVQKYVAIASLGGFISRMFDLRGKVDASEIEANFKSIGIKRVKAGTQLLEQDAVDDRRLYIIRSGTVRLVHNDGHNEYPLGNLSAGEVFGEKACLLRQGQHATVVADDEAVLLVVPDRTVHFILEQNPKVRETLEQRIARADRELKRQIELSERRKRNPLVDLWSRPAGNAKLIRRFQLVQQAEEMDCGAACLAMITRHYGINITLGKLRELANVTREGATLDSLAKVGESLGFTTRGMRCSYDALLGFDMPFIAHWEGYHYVVVYGISKRHVWVADPGPGFRKMTVEEFEKGWTGVCLLFTPSDDMATVEDSPSPWLRFIRYVAPYKSVMGYLFLATFVIQLLGIVPPIITQNILDRVIVHNNYSLLTILIGGLVITNVFSQLTLVMRGLLSNFMVRNLDFSMMSGFLRHSLALPLSFYAKRKTGDVFARFQENETIRAFLTESTLATVLNLMMVVLYLTILFLYSTLLTSLLLILIVPIVILTVAATPKLKGYARDVFDKATTAEATLMEMIGGIETIKGMGIERPMRMKWERQFVSALNVKYRAQRFNILIGFVSQIFNATISITILAVGARLVMSQELTIGQLMAYSALMGMVLGPLMGLVGLWGQFHSAGVAMERLGDILDMEPEQKPETLASRIVIPDLQGAIDVKDMYFRYGGNETPYVLENINLRIEPGQVVSIVGQSGSGKTTLAKLIVGFYPPSEGKIVVDGYDLDSIDKEYYRAQIGYVMQSNLLFSGTIAENIAAGVDNPDRSQIMRVSKLADAHNFIANMPLGYDQVVGERGTGLSGGQIQRLCIARGLYHDPKLLIFDEATSALDTQSESNIMHNMKDILAGRTAIVIAHRLSTIMNSDKIVVLYRGAIVEEGRHDELVDRRGMYFQLVKKQMSANS